MKTLELILTILEVVVSVALVVVVLLQSGKQSGLSGAISGNSDNYMSKSSGGLDHILATSTKWIAAAWVLLTLSLSLV